jgi:orotidine-5'-phosphate decarboxylase
MDASRLIVALDVRGKQHALALVEQLEPVGLKHVKVGMSLFYEAGISLVEQLRARGLDVFVDLKLHDIPNTVARTVDVLIQGGCTFLNVHCLGGQEMLQRANEQAQISAQRLGIPSVKLIGVTILTSHDAHTLQQDLQCSQPLETMVEHLAKQAQQAGLDGVVCSPLEASRLRDVCGSDFLKVTPGIRLAPPTGHDDQSRVMTAQKAFATGATHIVVGRPVYEADSPADSFKALLDSFGACS